MSSACLGTGNLRPPWASGGSDNLPLPSITSMYERRPPRSGFPSTCTCTCPNPCSLVAPTDPLRSRVRVNNLLFDGGAGTDADDPDTLTNTMSDCLLIVWSTPERSLSRSITYVATEPTTSTSAIAAEQ